METSPEPEQVAQMDDIADESDNPIVGVYNTPTLEAPGLEALSTAATSNMQYIRQVSVPESSPRGINTPQHFTNNIDFILNPVGTENPTCMTLLYSNQSPLIIFLQHLLRSTLPRIIFQNRTPTLAISIALKITKLHSCFGIMERPQDNGKESNTEYNAWLTRGLP